MSTLAVSDDKLNMRDNELVSLEVAKGGACAGMDCWMWASGCEHDQIQYSR